jgi:Ca-activated chloride channel family protein
MSFIWPFMLVFLLLVPLFVVLYFRIQRQRRRLVSSYGGLAAVQGTVGRVSGARRHIPPMLFLASLIILIVALARPQAVVSLPRIEGIVILAFDISGSMAADDMTPNRMEAAKSAVEDFVQSLPPTVRVGVVAFSDSGLSVQAPTNEHDTILGAIRRLAPQRGTSLANGMAASLGAILLATSEEVTNYYSNLTPVPTPSPTPMPQGVYTSNVIVLLTDGENTEEPDPLTAAQAAADQGVRIYTVGIGSAAGTILNIEGFNVHTRLDEAMLQQISAITGGVYYNAENQEELETIYNTLDPQLVIKPEEMEITPIFAGAGIFTMLIGGAFALLWFGRLP